MDLPIELSRKIQDFIRPRKCLCCLKNLTLYYLCIDCCFNECNECDNCGKTHYDCYCEY